MLRVIRESKVTKFICLFLVFQFFLEVTGATYSYALTEGPSQPEFNSFTPISTNDMVDLASGDFNYNIPIMDVGGYPINLAYNSGVTMDQEASWVGLGWNLNIGQINRTIRGLPDDFNGDEIEHTNNMRPNVTVSVNSYMNPQIFGLNDRATGGASAGTSNAGNSGGSSGSSSNTGGTSGGTSGGGGSSSGGGSVSMNARAGLEVRYNNYTGLSANPTFGVSFNLAGVTTLGLQMTASDEIGASISPSVSMTPFVHDCGNSTYFRNNVSAGISYNSRQGLQNFNLSSSMSSSKNQNSKDENRNDLGSGSGSYNFNNTQFTPNGRLEFTNSQFTFSFSFGPNIGPAQIETSIAASATIQRIKFKEKRVRAFGYENSEYATTNDQLDFQRENDLGVFSPSTNLLPQTTYTYDILSIQSQKLGGSFRPYRSQIGYVYDPLAQDNSTSTNASLETENGFGTHFGASLFHTRSNNYTSGWNTIVTPYLRESYSRKLDYQPVYYKTVGELSVNNQRNEFLRDKYGNRNPITLSLNHNDAVNRYLAKSSSVSSLSSSLSSSNNFSTTDLLRENREFKNKAIQKVTKLEAIKLGLSGKFVNVNTFAKNHHTAAYLITDENGGRHVFGETAYNIEKNETSFATNSNNIDCKKGLVRYLQNENTENNKSGLDHYYNNIKTGPYAHTYLLTSVLSPDYQDIGNDGITDDDLGTYVKFEYTKQGDQEYSNNYKWRVPFESGMASYSEGFKSNTSDEKASYLYGIKEIKYIKRIETKTHVAVFDYGVRKDGYGVSGVNGGLNPNMKTYYLKSIRLYSKSSTPFFPNGVIPSSIKPVKTAHFEYSYSLCKGIPNNIENNQGQQDFGKLTLTKVFFTYQDSNLGQYTPYKFYYGKVGTNDVNKQYAPKDYDIWGNYKSNSDNCNDLTAQEFPYVEQEEREEQNILAANWTLTDIELPSGGKIKLSYESDDYKYVQDKRAMRMFKVFGVCDSDKSNIRQNLYDNSSGYDAEYVVVKLDPSLGLDGLSDQEILKRCTEGLSGKPIYFDFFLKMTDNSFEHIVGYFDMSGQAEIQTVGTDKLLFIKMKHINREGGRTTAPDFNPISVTAWFFGRQNLHRQIYNLPDTSNDQMPNVLNLAKSLVNNLSNLINIFKGENKRLYNRNCANDFIPSKSWIRLNEPTYKKLGGGSRVKKVEIFDEWDKMVDVDPNSPDIQRYKRKYGQEYSYQLSDGASSGVATYEPNMSKENPLVTPFYFNDEKRALKKYCETPIGASFYPNPTVTYSRVVVKNITASDDDSLDGVEERKTKSGTVVSTFYTTYDFPTFSDVTPIDNQTRYFYSNENGMLRNLLLTSLGVPLTVKNEMVLSQGFQVETNDMNGKLKRQEVFNFQGELISYTEDLYHVDNNNPKKLDNQITTIDSKGKVDVKTIGVDYDIVNDLRLNYNSSVTTGLNANTEFIGLGLLNFIYFSGIFDYQRHDQIFKASTTTKVVHRMGILKERIAFDLGAKVSTKNLAYDSETGNVLLTETQNEFDDHYYSLNYPAYWHYDRMGLASKNVDLEGFITREKDCEIDGKPFFKVNNKYNEFVNNANSLFRLGDELMLVDLQTPNNIYTKYWVVGNNGDTNNGLILMDSNGNYLDDCGTNENTYHFRLIRSGYRNMATGSMATITLMKNPLLQLDSNGHLSNFDYDFLSNNNPNGINRVLNVSAIEYTDFWPSQQEGGMTEYPLVNSQNGLIADTPSQFPFTVGFNPYLRNVNGQFRASKSWAYLTGRIGFNSSIRNQGFLKKYNPFYRLNSNYKWEKQVDNWTFASSISKYSPYGAEVENKDALNRYSSAQYGYMYTLPMAIASNSRYNEMGFEGFEESIGNVNKHFEFKPLNGSTNLNAIVSNEQSHTGKRSVKVTNGASVILKKKLSRNSNKEVMPNCPVEECTELIEISQPVHFYVPNIQNVNLQGMTLDFYNNQFQQGEVYNRRFKVKASCGAELRVGTINYDHVTIERDSLIPDELFIVVRGVFWVQQGCPLANAYASVGTQPNNGVDVRSQDVIIPIYVNSFLTYVRISPAIANVVFLNGQFSPSCLENTCTNSDGQTNDCIQILEGTSKCMNTYPEN